MSDRLTREQVEWLREGVRAANAWVAPNVVLTVKVAAHVLRTLDAVLAWADAKEAYERATVFERLVALKALVMAERALLDSIATEDE